VQFPQCKIVYPLNHTAHLHNAISRTINGAWDAKLCSQVISAGRTKQEQNKRGAQGAGPLPRYVTRPGFEYGSPLL